MVRETAALTDRPFCGNLVLTSDQHRRLDEALEAGLRIVSLFLGDPAGYVERVHDAGGLRSVYGRGSAGQGRGGRSPAELMSSWRRVGRLGGTWGVRLHPDLYDVDWPDSPHRALRNSTTEMWEAVGQPPLESRPGVGDVIAYFALGEAIVRYEPAPPMVGTTGEIEPLSMWAGQSVALARQPRPAAEIVAELVSRL